MATSQTNTSATLPPAPDPSKEVPPTPAPKEHLPIATSSLPKDLQGTAGQEGQPAVPTVGHYFGVWTAVGAIVVLVAIAVTLFVLIRDRQEG
jgi:hypothetical protein